MKTTGRKSELDALTLALHERGVGEARVALVLGSGLGAFAERLEDARVFDYGELKGMPRSGVVGHAGRLVLGKLGGVTVVVQQGRVHLYEGRSAGEVTRAVRAFGRLGVRDLVLTNAAGGLRKEWGVPSLMRITDHVNLQGVAPVRREEAGFGEVYDGGLGAVLEEAARERGVELHRGVYAGLSGPAYETPAEIAMLRWLGADAAGMSTVAEACAGRACGMRVAAVSCITNLAAGVSEGPLSHEEVVEAGRVIGERFGGLLEGAVARLG